MRLVWALIPLILIVSMIGIVGVQESFSQCVQNEDFPYAPCLDETTVALYEHMPQEPFELQKTKGVSFGSDRISFRLLDVEDSRCPSDVQCIWEGQVTVNVDVNAGWEPLGNYTISLNESLDGSLIQLDQYLLELINVEPYPISTESILMENYVATMQFSLKEIQSPKKQLELGFLPHQVQCKEGLELIFKPSGIPACVKPLTAEKLIQRGWTS